MLKPGAAKTIFFVLQAVRWHSPGNYELETDRQIVAKESVPGCSGKVTDTRLSK